MAEDAFEKFFRAPYYWKEEIYCLQCKKYDKDIKELLERRRATINLSDLEELLNG